MMTNRMRKLGLTIVLATLATAAAAQSRLPTAGLSCSQARGLVTAHGAIVLGTGPYTYERYVRDQGFCPYGEQAVPGWERTADVAQCQIGFRCRSVEESRDVW